jgi:outer membrane receptor for ferrienterochelin and colicin
LLAGGRRDKHSLFGSNLSPKIGLQYKISETLSVRSNYGQGFRVPSLYYVYNSQANILNDGSIYYESVSNTEVSPEKFQAFEIGIRHSPVKKIDIELILIYNKIKEKITTTLIPLDHNLYPNATPGQDTVTVFANDKKSQAELYSAQINVRAKNLLPAVKLNSSLFVTLSKGKEILPNNYGELNDYRNVPNWFVQLNFDFRPLKNWVIILNNTFSDHWKKRYFPAPLEVMEQNGLPVNVDGYYTLDITNRFSINRNFHAFLILNNVSNTKYGGLDAHSSPFDLKYNPQYRFAFQLGFSFTLE